ncbi:protein phosphatase 2C domain-containing protein [Limnospira platensis CENA597]|uniref:protein phosphatase 2C domain-containing protein n=1 Tax=Limnospira platensis TaxID=118562 RepID=UPI003D6EBE4F
MSNHHNKQEWQVIGKTVRGSSHVRNNLPNQDAMGWWPDSKKGHSLILVVADGHGSSKSFRSDQGSRLAVNSAKQTLQDFLTEISKTDLVQNLASIKQIAELDLPKELIKNWKSEVQKNFSEHPFTDEEWIKLKNQEGIQQREQVEKIHLLPMEQPCYLL